MILVYENEHDKKTSVSFIERENSACQKSDLRFGLTRVMVI
jgi:hypothetical protein